MWARWLLTRVAVYWVLVKLFDDRLAEYCCDFDSGVGRFLSLPARLVVFSLIRNSR